MITFPDHIVEERLEKLVDFAVENGGEGCFSCWSRDLIRQYLMFHAGQQTLAYVTDEMGRIIALGVAWCQPAGDYEFQWQRNDDKADTIFIAEVIATVPQAKLYLIGRLVRRWPDYKQKKIKARRHGKIRDINERYLSRLILQEVRHGY